MASVYVQLIGCGDAFGSGGRFQTSFYVRYQEFAFLIDCGATTLTALRRGGLDPRQVSAILVSHLHGDHFGGLPFFLLDARHNSRRTEPVILAGPPGLEERTEQALEVLYPGASSREYRFALDYVHLPGEATTQVGPLEVTTYPAVHLAGAPAYTLRIRCGDKVIAYSGDTEWTDALPEAARGADLFLVECCFFDRQARYHLNYQTLVQNREELECRRLVLVHMSEDMLSRADDDVEMERAEDGTTFVL